jgi:hypothetical protein
VIVVKGMHECLDARMDVSDTSMHADRALHTAKSKVQEGGAQAGE